MTRTLVWTLIAVAFCAVPSAMAQVPSGLQGPIDGVAATGTQALDDGTQTLDGVTQPVGVNATALVNQSGAVQIESSLGLGPPPPEAGTSTSSSGPAPARVAVSSAGKAAGAVSLGALALLGMGAVAHHAGWLRWAPLGLAVPLFSRITGERVLDNEVRARIHQAVCENPGITLKEVAATAGVGWGTAVHHLGRLEQERLIVSERARQFRRFYKNGGGIVNEEKAAFSELKHPMAHQIAVSIIEHPGTCQKDLAQGVGISAPLAHKYLGRLHEAGLVSTERQWKAVKYYPTERLTHLMTAAAPVMASPALTPPISAMA